MRARDHKRNVQLRSAAMAQKTRSKPVVSLFVHEAKEIVDAVDKSELSEWMETFDRLFFEDAHFMVFEKDGDESCSIYWSFKVKDYIVNFEVFDHDGKSLLTFKYYVDYKEYRVDAKHSHVAQYKSIISILDKDAIPVIGNNHDMLVKATCALIVAIFMSTMYFFQIRTPRFIEPQKAIRNEGYKKWNPDYNPIKRLMPSQVVRPMNGVRSYLEQQRQRLTESWHVRGHLRKYKSGKETWVRPYVKGTGENMRLSIYAEEAGRASIETL